MKNTVLISVGLALLAGLFWWMKPAPPPPAPVAMAPSVVAPDVVAPPVPTTPASPTAQQFELVVKAQKLVSGPAVISVPQGTPVTLRITVDQHDELHLHGYDLTLKLPADMPIELSFIADKSGRFEYELHHSHLDLGALEVQPQ